MLSKHYNDVICCIIIFNSDDWFQPKSGQTNGHALKHSHVCYALMFMVLMDLYFLGLSPYRYIMPDNGLSLLQACVQVQSAFGSRRP
jgi:hypothetical protein